MEEWQIGVVIAYSIMFVWFILVFINNFKRR